VQQNLFLLDHLVGERQQLVRNLEFERLGGSQIDRQLEFGGLHDRQLGRLGAVKNLTGIDADLTPHVRNIGPIAHQPAGGDELTPLVGGRDAVAGGQGQDRRAQTWNKVLAPKTTALALRSTMAAKAALTSVSFDTPRTRMSCPIAWAAASISRTWNGVVAAPELTTTAISVALGTNSRNR